MKKISAKFLGIMLASLFVSTFAFGSTHSSSQDSQKNIVQTAKADKDLSTLVTAIKAAGLVDTLKGKGPFTVFAPNNAAFAALPKGELQKLLHNKKELTAILTYHVVPGEVTSSDIQSGPVKTVEGQELTIVKNDQGVTVNNAKVVKADIKASNGVIHVIDAVLMPPKATM